MNVISKPNLFQATRLKRNSQLSEKVARWYELASKNDFENFVEVKKLFLSADFVEGKLVFNLSSYRLICGVSFLRRAFYVKGLLSHSVYEQGGWKS